MNLAELMTETAKEHGDRVALKLDDAEVTYEMLDEGSQLVAGLLKANGFEVGDRVGIMLPNVPYFGPIYYGVLRAGGVVVPMNPLLKGREVAYYLSDNGAKFLFAWHGFEEPAKKGADDEGAKLWLVEPGEFEKTLGEAEPDDTIEDRDEADTAVLLYTSGTTGKPKGAELTHAEPDQATPRPPVRSSPSARTTSSSARCRCSTRSGRPAGSTPPWPSAA